MGIERHGLSHLMGALYQTELHPAGLPIYVGQDVVYLALLPQGLGCVPAGGASLLAGLHELRALVVGQFAAILALADSSVTLVSVPGCHDNS